MGLMWASGDDRNKMLNTLRDTCEQNDGMQGYGWTFYDARIGGSQIVHDTQLRIDLETAFVKADEGNSWAVRVTGAPKSDSVKTSLIFHTAVEKADSNGPKTLVCKNRTKDGKGIEATCDGQIAALGEFQLRIVGDAANKALHDTAVKSVQVTEDKIWQAKRKFGTPGSPLVKLQLIISYATAVFVHEVKAAGGGPNKNVAVENKPGAGNMHFVQLTFQGPFVVTFSYRELEASGLDSRSIQISMTSDTN